MHPSTAAPLMVLLGSLLLLAGTAAARSLQQVSKPGYNAGYQITNATYRVLNSTVGANPPWTSTGLDHLSGKGFKMTPVNDTELGTVVTSLNSSYGPLGVAAAPSMYSTDLAAELNVNTTWPYCANLTSCVVSTQKDAATAPLVLTLPPGVSAIDLYIDLYIDCLLSDVLSLVSNCSVNVLPKPFWPIPGKTGDWIVTVNSTCSDPSAGLYLGVSSLTRVSTIDSVTISCEQSAPLLIGMLRVGSIKAPIEGELQPSEVQVATV